MSVGDFFLLLVTPAPSSLRRPCDGQQHQVRAAYPQEEQHGKEQQKQRYKGHVQSLRSRCGLA